MTEITTDWSAARSGASITITLAPTPGDLELVKITDVRIIQPVEGRPGWVEAITKTGDVHRLSCG